MVPFLVPLGAVLCGFSRLSAVWRVAGSAWCAVAYGRLRRCADVVLRRLQNLHPRFNSGRRLHFVHRKIDDSCRAPRPFDVGRGTPADRTRGRRDTAATGNRHVRDEVVAFKTPRVPCSVSFMAMGNADRAEFGPRMALSLMFLSSTEGRELACIASDEAHRLGQRRDRGRRSGRVRRGAEGRRPAASAGRDRRTGAGRAARAGRPDAGRSHAARVEHR